QNAQQHRMVQPVEALNQVSLDIPLDPSPVPGDFPQGGVTTSASPEPVRVPTELRLIIRFQKGANHFLQQFIRPGRNPERPQLSRFLGNVRPSGWSPSIAFLA